MPESVTGSVVSSLVSRVCGDAVGGWFALENAKSARASTFAFATTVLDCGLNPTGSALTCHALSALRSPSGTPSIR